ncbi:ferritin-like domain-containing protein [Vallitalea okinawensis]|uniref:ferritin-like domain-containing protein n=1 Tax=Vallitalea okinawensis TaxID=2078660 RepID=UPI000CFDFC7E|nr:ferritin-like domain-containing protein [Vallitalea okinawensis]
MDYYLDQLNTALKLIHSAIFAERECSLFYDYMIENCPSEEDEEVLTSIRDNALKHSRQFRELYYQFTGQMIFCTDALEYEEPSSYLEGLKYALMCCQYNVRNYQMIIKCMPSRSDIGLLFNIISDELLHGTNLSYLIANNLYEK